MERLVTWIVVKYKRASACVSSRLLLLNLQMIMVEAVICTQRYLEWHFANEGGRSVAAHYVCIARKKAQETRATVI